MPQTIAGTFTASATTTAVGQASDVLVLPSGLTDLRLTITGPVDGSNQVRVQRAVEPGGNWLTALTASAPVGGVLLSSLGLTVAGFAHWRLIALSGQASKNIQYSLSAES